MKDDRVELVERAEAIASKYAEETDRSNLVPAEALEELLRIGVFDARSLGPIGVIEVVRGISRYSPGMAHVVLVHSTSIYTGRLDVADGIVAFSMTEPGGGSDVLANLKTVAEEVDGNRVVINGVKMFTSNAPYAKYFLVLARGREGPALYLAEKDETIEVEVLDLLGLRGTGSSKVVYNNTPGELVGTPGKGLKEALTGINMGRLGYAAIALGIADASLEMAVTSASKKTVFGKRLIEYQGLRWRIAEIAMEREALEALVYSTARLAEETGGVDPYKAAVAKNLGASLAQKATWMATQTLGGRGLARWSRPERLMRDARVLDIGEGSREVLLDFIASRIVKMYS
ncbi:MAG: acyl-CoA/acyl-ACP dehydrogenase [Desulfurococcales archaeon]|nr:acyl-CoA/acyl-ACP dehydrogenase [Desulfurococcales archaeon]